jgi:hypothetical protein
MTKEIKEVPQICPKCNDLLDLRITNDKDGIYIIYGICKKYNIVYFLNIFIQEEQPVQDKDYIIVNKKGNMTK